MLLAASISSAVSGSSGWPAVAMGGSTVCMGIPSLWPPYDRSARLSTRPLAYDRPGVRRRRRSATATMPRPPTSRRTPTAIIARDAAATAERPDGGPSPWRWLPDEVGGEPVGLGVGFGVSATETVAGFLP